MKWLAFTATGVFAIVGGTMNVLFARTLGSDVLTTYCWCALSIGATLYTVSGADIIARAWQQRHRARALAASAILLLSLSYDVLAAYGFAATQLSRTSHEADRTIRVYRDAEAAVRRAQADLEPYLSAPDLDVARAAEQTIVDEIAGLDRIPGITTKAGLCVRPATSGAIKACPRRLELADALRTASTTRARAEAKARLSSVLSAAQARLSATSAPRPRDPRAAVLGGLATELLPVALLTLGALLGFFAASAGAPQPLTPAAPEPAAKPIRPSVPLPIPAAALTPSRPAKPGAEKLALTLAGLSAHATPPAGILIDAAGWIHGSQRALAHAAGFKTISGFHRVLHDAAAAGDVELDINGRRTAVRPRNISQGPPIPDCSLANPSNRRS